MKTKLLSIALTTILITSCGAGNFATTLRVALAAGAPVLNTLVAQGKISPALRDGLIADLSSEALAVGDMATCFDAIPSGDAQSKLKHLQCVQTLDSSAATKKLIADFSKNPNVQNIADDIESIIEAASIFYGSMNKKASVAAGGKAQTVSEADIKTRIAILKHDLGQ